MFRDSSAHTTIGHCYPRARSLRLCKPSCKSTEALLLLTQFPSIFREDYPRSFSGLASFRAVITGDLEHYPAPDSSAKGTVEVASVGCSAVEVARLVLDHTAKRLRSICAASEAVEHGLFTCPIQLEHHPAP